MNLTRRYFLKSTGALACYLGVAPRSVLGTLTPRRVIAGRTLVVIFLRGGADGLNLIVPHGDPNYAPLRPGLAIPGAGEGGVIDLDGYFGLHPRLAALHPYFRMGHARALHAIGYDRNTRSHFEEQDVWETGIIGNTVNSDGWVNRHLATSEGHGAIRAVSVGDSLPRILHGRAPAYAIRGLDDLTLPSQGRGQDEHLAAALERAYRPSTEGERSDARDLLRGTAAGTLDAVRELRAMVGTDYAPAAAYPETELARRLREVARLIKANVGLEVAEVDYGGWDTHQDQGFGAQGQFANLAGQLGDAMAAFAADLGDRLSDVLVVTLTDFGRTARENGTRGTDHGWANAMLLMGGGVSRAAAGNAEVGGVGGTPLVMTDWPGLAPDQLHEERDLLHTTDFRDVLAEVVRVHLGNDRLADVLPSHEFKRVGVLG